MKTGIVGPSSARVKLTPGRKTRRRSLEDRRKPHVPDRERKHERLGGQETIHRGDVATVHRQVVVVDPILSRRHRIEAFRVEIAIVDLVTPRAQDLDDFGMQGRAETRLDRMGEQDQDARRRSALCRARPRLEAREKEVSAGGKIKFRFSQAIILPGLSSPSGSVSRLNASWIRRFASCRLPRGCSGRG